MRIVGMLCALNEEEFIDDFISLNLPLLDELVIAEGAVLGQPFANKDGSSIDETKKIIEMHIEKNPGKITFVNHYGKWKSKQEQQNSMFKYVNDGDWCWIFGADEFYKPTDRKLLELLIKKYPKYVEFVPSFMHFWDKNHIFGVGDVKDYRLARRHQRIFRYRPELKYVNHPTVNDIANLDTFFNPHYDEFKLILDVPRGGYENENNEFDDSFSCGQFSTNPTESITCYHYGSCRNKLHQIMKHLYYIMRGNSLSAEEALLNIMNRSGGNIDSLIDKFRNPSGASLVEYSGYHPLWYKEFKDESIDINSIKEFTKNFFEIAKK